MTLQELAESLERHNQRLNDVWCLVDLLSGVPDHERYNCEAAYRALSRLVGGLVDEGDDLVAKLKEAAEKEPKPVEGRGG